MQGKLHWYNYDAGAAHGDKGTIFLRVEGFRILFRQPRGRRARRRTEYHLHALLPA